MSAAVSSVVETTPLVTTSRARRLGVAAGVAAVTGYVYLMDPDKGGAYPLCPSRALLGVDCPLCGGLRGTNAMLHGRVREALDHNVLLPIYLAVGALMLGIWLLPLFGKAERRLNPPRWLAIAAVTVLAGFTLVRNLPFSTFDYLGSGT